MSLSVIYNIKEERLMLTRKMVLRKVFGPKRGRVLGVGCSYGMRVLTACVLATC